MTKKELAEIKAAKTAHAVIASMALMASAGNKDEGAKKAGPKKPTGASAPKQMSEVQVARRKLEKMDLSPKRFHMYSKASASHP